MLALPDEDLKPPMTSPSTPKTCQTPLSAAALADEKTKAPALGKEQDAALKLDREGSLRPRIGRCTMVCHWSHRVAAKAR